MKHRNFVIKLCLPSFLPSSGSVTIGVPGVPGGHQRLGVDITQLVHQSLVSDNSYFIIIITSSVTHL